MLEPLLNEIQEAVVNLVAKELNKNSEARNLSYKYEYTAGLHKFVLLDGTVAVSHVRVTEKDLFIHIINDMLECAESYLIHMRA